MCVILGIPSDKHVSRKELKKCFTYNSDGAGFTYFDGKRSVISKGYMTFNSFYKAYTARRKEYSTSNFVVHFRIATHGSINEAMTQPFPCGPSMLMGDLSITDITSDVVIAHNGIISGYGMGNHSDTAHFIYTVLAPLSSKHKAWYKMASIMHLLDLLIDSKMLIFSKNQFYFIGDFTLENGIYYSNLCHRRVYKYQTKFNDMSTFNINSNTSAFNTVSSEIIFAHVSRIDEGVIHFTSGRNALVSDYTSEIYISDEYDYYFKTLENFMPAQYVAWISDEHGNLITFDSNKSEIMEVNA